MKKLKISHRRIGILGVGILLGVLVMIQWVSYKKVAAITARDTAANIFSELTILKNTNQNLREEIEALNNQLDKSSNRFLAHQAILEEIEKNWLLTGEREVQGPGIKINIRANIEAIWLVDLVNELWSAGAEAIAVNGIRLTSETIGFEPVQGNQIILGEYLLSQPYKIEAIGDKQILEQALTQAGGMVGRIKAAYPEVKIQVGGISNIEFL